MDRSRSTLTPGRACRLSKKIMVPRGSLRNEEGRRVNVAGFKAVTQQQIKCAGEKGGAGEQEERGEGGVSREALHFFEVPDETLDKVGVDFVQAIPDAVEDADVFAEEDGELGDGVAAAAEFALVVAVGLEAGDGNEATGSQVGEAGEVEGAQGAAEIALLEQTPPIMVQSSSGRSLLAAVFSSSRSGTAARAMLSTVTERRRERIVRRAATPRPQATGARTRKSRPSCGAPQPDWLESWDSRLRGKSQSMIFLNRSPMASSTLLPGQRDAFEKAVEQTFPFSATFFPGECARCICCAG